MDKWDKIWSERGATDSPPSTFLSRVAGVLPRAGRAVDIAGGAGRNAIWLAGRGLDVTCADRSTVGLELAAAAAERAGVSIATVEHDCDPGPPGDDWDLAVCVHFLSRPLLGDIAARLAPGGLFAFVQPTVKNLERHAKPSRRWLLEVGEIHDVIDTRLEIVVCDEGWSEDGRHEVELLARRPLR